MRSAGAEPRSLRVPSGHWSNLELPMRPGGRDVDAHKPRQVSLGWQNTLRSVRSKCSNMTARHRTPGVRGNKFCIEGTCLLETLS
eukprot:scaffold375126_cov35-Prasinocladus_malaysianus.AAC.1